MSRRTIVQLTGGLYFTYLKITFILFVDRTKELGKCYSMLCNIFQIKLLCVEFSTDRSCWVSINLDYEKCGRLPNRYFSDVTTRRFTSVTNKKDVNRHHSNKTLIDMEN